jgi:hypothetical protein
VFVRSIVRYATAQGIWSQARCGPSFSAASLGKAFHTVSERPSGAQTGWQLRDQKPFNQICAGVPLHCQSCIANPAIPCPPGIIDAEAGVLDVDP